MASIFKRGGKKNRHGKYTASYMDEHGKRVCRSTGTADFEVACQIAGKWETDTALRKSGIITASQSRVADHNRRHLNEHVADYLLHCEHIGQAPVHVANKKTQLEKLVKGIDATRLSDLEPNKVERYLASLVKSGLSHRTHNQHRATVVTFMEWCFEQSRIAANPLKIVPTLNEAKDRRRIRRAMTEEELSKLISVSESRRPYYLFAYYTGLRVKAVKAAVWGDVDFENSIICVRVGNAKGKREDTFYTLHPRIVTELQKIKPAFLSPTARIFKTVPTVRTFHEDCKRAKVARYDSEHRRIDRHALRTTLGTHLALAGVLPQQAMRVMGHTDVRVTMKHYTALRLSDTAASVQSLPSIQVQPQTQLVELQATGTDGATPASKGKRKRIQQKRQQLGGISGHSVSSSVTNVGATKESNQDSGEHSNPLEIKPFVTIRHGGTSPDLLNIPTLDNMPEARAIGAVG